MNNSTFTQDFVALSSYLKGFAFTLTKDYNSAQDLFQETALKAFRHKDSFQKNTNMKAWLSRIMKNSFINQFRKKKKRKNILDVAEISSIQHQIKNKVLNEGEVNIEVKEILQMIDDLDEWYRTPFLLVYQGYRYHEIQKILKDVPLGTIKSRIHHARRILKQKIRSKNKQPASN